MFPTAQRDHNAQSFTASLGLAPAPRPSSGTRPVQRPAPSVSPVSPALRAFRSRVELYGLALATDQTPNAYGLTPEDRAGGMLDRLPVADAMRAMAALRAAEVTL